MQLRTNNLIGVKKLIGRRPRAEHPQLIRTLAPDIRLTLTADEYPMSAGRAERRRNQIRRDAIANPLSRSPSRRMSGYGATSSPRTEKLATAKATTWRRSVPRSKLRRFDTCSNGNVNKVVSQRTRTLEAQTRRATM